MPNQTNLRRLVAQREVFRKKDQSLLVANHEKSVFYQLDFLDVAESFAKDEIVLPRALPGDDPLIRRIYNHMFRSQVMKISGVAYKKEKQKASALLREGLVGSVLGGKQQLCLDVYRDQIMWGRGPVCIDSVGGWTDAPSYCLYADGDVMNAAIELNG